MLIKIISHTTGKELTVPHQMSLAGAVSLPVFWLAGAGAAVFWVLGEHSSDCTDACYTSTSASVEWRNATIYICYMHSHLSSEYFVTMILFLALKPVGVSLFRSNAGCDRHSRCIPWAGAVGRGRAAHGARVKAWKELPPQGLCKDLSSLFTAFNISNTRSQRKNKDTFSSCVCVCVHVCACLQCHYLKNPLSLAILSLSAA